MAVPMGAWARGRVGENVEQTERAGTVPTHQDITAVAAFVRTLADLPAPDLHLKVAQQAGWIFRLYCDQFSRPETTGES